MTPRDRTMAVIKDIAKQHKVSVRKIFSRAKDDKVSAARQHCYWHLREKGKSLPEIGRIMGRDHSSVHHGVAKHIERNALMPENAGCTAGLI